MVFPRSEMKWCLASEVNKRYSTDCGVFADQILNHGHRSLFASHVKSCCFVRSLSIVQKKQLSYARAQKASKHEENESYTRHSIRKIVTRVVNQLDRGASDRFPLSCDKKLCKSTKSHNSVNTNTAFQVTCKDCKQSINFNLIYYFCDQNPVHFCVTYIETLQTVHVTIYQRQ